MIASVCDEAFAPYGDVLEGYDTQELCRRLQRRATGEGVRYQASLPELEALPLRTALEDRAFGGMPIQIGVCEGRNTRLNCLEYHQCSEINIGADDFILLVARPGGNTERAAGYWKGAGIPGSRGDGCTAVCHHPALCPLPPEGGGRLLRGHCASPGHQRRKAGDLSGNLGGSLAVGTKQMVAGTSG